MRPCLALCAAAAACVPLAAAAAPAAPAGDLDGALTLVAQWGPDYLGARDRGVGLRPGVYLRWKRLSISSGGGWASPRQDDELRGLGLELASSDSWRVSVGLRADSGRDESSSPALAGMGDVKRTLRARIGATWQFRPDWELRAAWTVDAFGRGGGNLGELRLQHEWTLSPRVHLSSGASASLAGDRYLQTYYGVTAEQAARSGYREFSPSMSLRDLTLFSSLRVDVGDDWVGTVGAGWTHMLGDASRSPLTQRRKAWSMHAGAGWRF